MFDLEEAQNVLLQYATKFLHMAEQSIQKAKKIDTGHLSIIELSAIKTTKDGLQITIGYSKSNPASKYYDYVNKGVKGVKNKSKAPKSPYQYKNLFVGRDMTNKILAWYMRHKNYVRNETQQTNLSALQTKRKTLAQVSENDKLKSIAYLTAKKIKREGLERIGFFDDNISKVFNQKFNQDIAKALGKDIVVSIKDSLNGNNSSK